MTRLAAAAVLVLCAGCTAGDEFPADIDGVSARGGQWWHGPCDRWFPLVRVCMVKPTGDATGVEDANAIEAAMAFVSDGGGGMVLLSDGRLLTQDTYYVSRSLVVPEFTGWVRAEHMYRSKIRPVRQSPAAGDGFAGDESPVWTPRFDLEPPTLFQLDDAQGDVWFTDLTVEMLEADISNPTRLYWADPDDETAYIDTSLWTVVELIGGEHHTRVERIQVLAPQVSHFSKGVGYALHDMAWAEDPLTAGFPPPKTESSFTVRDVYLENIVWGAILSMDMAGDGGVTLDDVTMVNVGNGLDIERHTAPVSITDVEVSVTDDYWQWVGAFLTDVHGADISDVTFTNADVTSIVLVGDTDVDVQDISYPNGGSACDYVYDDGGNNVEGLDGC